MSAWRLYNDVATLCACCMRKAHLNEDPAGYDADDEGGDDENHSDDGKEKSSNNDNNADVTETVKMMESAKLTEKDKDETLSESKVADGAQKDDS